VVGIGAALGALSGLFAAWLANVLPGRYGITHVPPAEKRRRRNLLLVVASAAVGAGVGHVLSAVEGDAPWHIALLLVVNVGVAAALLAGFAIDVEHMILPNEITLGTALVCLASSPARGVGWKMSIAGAVIGFLFTYAPFLLYKWVKKQSGMGIGDAKLAVAAGAWHGIEGMIFVVFAGALQHVLLGVVMRGLGIRYAIPESVRAEIAALKERAAAGDADAAEELADDPLANEEQDGLGKMRLPMGPALVVASIEALFLRRWLLDTVVPWLFG
jgi:leader peptidase (prepilin peptidase)/N-methyltransferase